MTSAPSVARQESPVSAPPAPPTFLAGHFAPVPDELTATDLRVRGALPPELSGRLLRNSHNPLPGVTPTHWFKGSGMLHGIRLHGGRAEWYRNRWVRTPALEGKPYMTPGGPDLTASTAGTHVIAHGGRILALCEANLPFEMSRELDTVGAYDFAGKLTTAMNAHPKVDPATGELHFYGYSPFPPYLTYHVASADGRLVRSEEIPGTGPSMMHDFAITEHYVVWLDLPVLFNAEELSGIPYRWSDDYPARIGLMRREGPAQVRWFEIEPGYILHLANAYEDGQGRVIIDGPRLDRTGWLKSWNWWAGLPGHGPAPADGAYKHRWTLDLATGVVREERTDDLVTEFPTLNDGWHGRAHRYDYAVSFPKTQGADYGLVKYDQRTGSRQLRPAGPERMPSEAVFVPAAGATGEDEGYLLSVVNDLRRGTAELLVLDATDITALPLATVELPRRVPGGIHGSWIPDALNP
jgi:carotenoid cleavage dioxygenase-like enzyme